MALKKHLLSNKPLCICVKDDVAYIGDSGGHIVSSRFPFITISPFYTKGSSPVSSLCFAGGFLFYANWNGEVGRISPGSLEATARKVEEGMIKCCKGLGPRIFVSVNLRVYVLSPELEIETVYEMESKVLCMEIFNADIYCGMSVPYLAVLGKNCWLSKHETSILGMAALNGDLLTCSADSTIRSFGNRVVFQGNKWIRSMKDEVFSEGENVWALGEKARCIYSHKADVSGLEKYGESVLSIGFDHFFCVYNGEERCFSDEEREIRALLEEAGEK